MPGNSPPTLNRLGHLNTQLGNLSLAESILREALEVSATVGHDQASAVAWNNLGVVFANRGEHSGALDAYRLARELHLALGNVDGELIVRHNLAVQLFHLGRLEEGLTDLRQVIRSRGERGEAREEGRAWTALAWGLTQSVSVSDTPAGRAKALLATALDATNRAIQQLKIHRANFDLAVAHEIRSHVFVKRGEFDSAVRDLEISLALADAGAADLLHGAWVRLRLGTVFRAQGDLDASRASLMAATATLETLGNRSGEVIAHTELARTERLAARIEASAAAYERALDAIERSRENLQIPEFRRSFLSGQQTIYAELVDLWAEAAWVAGHAQRPPGEVRQRVQELAKRAFRVAERSRARALLDAVIPFPRQPPGVEPTQESHRDRLRRRVDILEAHRSLPNANRMLEGAIRSGPDLAHRVDLTSDHDDKPLLERLRRARLNWEWSREAELRRSRTPTPVAGPFEADVVIDLLTPDTVVLAYALGDERSWLFRIDSSDIFVFPLAPRRQLESAARRAHELLPRQNATGYRLAARAALSDLARLTLDPLSDGPRGPSLPKHLMVIPAGALHTVPFGLIPGTDGKPFLVSHSVIHLPSASAWIHLRRRQRARPIAPNLLALVADPVFEADDPRLSQEGHVYALDPSHTSPTHLARAASLRRLPATLNEARLIADLVEEVTNRPRPPIYHGVDASRDFVSSGQLRSYQIVHLATHGLLDTEDPALASLVLSLFDAEGRNLDGLLPARDLYDLRLDANLVVLSACSTALGQPIRGEGLVGLAHGFFAAGASQLVVSLWEVDDHATSELMVRFYRHLLKEGRNPAQALRLAQLELREISKWSSPRYWGAFVVLGDAEIRVEAQASARGMGDQRVETR